MLRIVIAALVFASLPLAGGMAQEGNAGDGSADTGAVQPRPQNEADCLAAGGRWARGGLSPRPLCFLPTPDAGQSCSRAEDCVGYCLSETRTCSPETPRFGCFGFLDENGVERVICVD